MFSYVIGVGCCSCDEVVAGEGSRLGGVVEGEDGGGRQW